VPILAILLAAALLTGPVTVTPAAAHHSNAAAHAEYAAAKKAKRAAKKPKAKKQKEEYMRAVPVR